MDDIVERVKAANPIEVVMEADGIGLGGHGRYRRSKEHDSLIVDVNKQYFVWNSMSHHGWDFKQAVEDLARRANIEAPVWGHEDLAAAAATRAREEALDVAAEVFAGWLWKAGDAPGTPLAYARGRGWSDETIKAARLGWTGDWNRDPGKAMYEELKGTMRSRGVDLDSPAAIAVMGFLGNVKSLKLTSDQMRPDWVDDGRIPSFYGRDMLVYPHERGGRVKYLSGRGIRQKVHYNLPGELVGNKQPYFNHAYSAKSDKCVIVEGQADAVSLAQWEIPGVALSGTAADNALLMALKGHQMVYVGLDEDKAGQNTCSPIAEALGPSCRIIHWRRLVESITKPALKTGRTLTREEAAVDQEPSPKGDVQDAEGDTHAHDAGSTPARSQGPARSARADLGDGPAAVPAESLSGSESFKAYKERLGKPVAEVIGSEEISDMTDEQLAAMAKETNQAWAPDSSKEEK
jgi:5S rRNA maturation endonuclease (ribonuclease M5)